MRVRVTVAVRVRVTVRVHLSLVCVPAKTNGVRVKARVRGGFVLVLVGDHGNTFDMAVVVVV